MRAILELKSIAELKKMIKETNITGYSKLNKKQIIDKMMKEDKRFEAYVLKSHKQQQKENAKKDVKKTPLKKLKPKEEPKKAESKNMNFDKLQKLYLKFSESDKEAKYSKIYGIGRPRIDYIDLIFSIYLMETETEKTRKDIFSLINKKPPSGNYAITERFLKYIKNNGDFFVKGWTDKDINDELNDLLKVKNTIIKKINKFRHPRNRFDKDITDNKYKINNLITLDYGNTGQIQKAYILKGLLTSKRADIKKFIKDVKDAILSKEKPKEKKPEPKKAEPKKKGEPKEKEGSDFVKKVKKILNENKGISVAGLIEVLKLRLTLNERKKLLSEKKLYLNETLIIQKIKKREFLKKKLLEV